MILTSPTHAFQVVAMVLLTVGASGLRSAEPESPAKPSRSESRKNEKSARSVTTPMTAPGQGISADKIEGVVMKLDYNMGLGGSMSMSYEPFLVLKDGSLFQGLAVPPVDVDLAKSRQEQTRQWGMWTKDGKELKVSWPSTGKTQSWKNWHWGRAARKGETLNGTFKTLSGGGNTALGGSSLTFSAKRLTFRDDGRFTLEETSGGSERPTGGGADVSAFASKEKAGTYVLDGYAAELRFNNGTLHRRLFYFYPDSTQHFRLGGSDYVPVK